MALEAALCRTPPILGNATLYLPCPFVSLFPVSPSTAANLLIRGMVFTELSQSVPASSLVSEKLA